MNESEPVKESDVIHRLKNHLCIIVGFCELLMANAGDDEGRRADLVEIHKAAHEAIKMIPEVAGRLR